MKNIRTSLLALVTLAASFGAFAANPEAESKTVEKAREAVATAASYDWQILAKSAEKCFSKNQNTEQALEWIDRSIEIYANPVNLEIKGDYFRANGQSKKAMEYYYKAITTGKEQSFSFDSKDLQKKLWDLRNESAQLESKGNYYHSLGNTNKAIKYYYLAIVSRKNMDFTAETGDLQQKIKDLKF